MKVTNISTSNNLKIAQLEWDGQSPNKHDRPCVCLAPMTQGQIQAMMLQLLRKDFFDLPELNELRDEVKKSIEYKMAFQQEEPRAGFTYTLNGELYQVIGVGVWHSAPQVETRGEKHITYTDSNGHLHTTYLASFKQEMTRVS